MKEGIWTRNWTESFLFKDYEELRALDHICFEEASVFDQEAAK